MIFGVLLNHVLDAFGVLYVITITVKVTKGYPVTRWLF